MTQAPQHTPYTTNNVGIPAESDEHSLTVGPDGVHPRGFALKFSTEQGD